MIKEGAKLVEDAEDIFTELLPQIKGFAPSTDRTHDSEARLSGEAKAILELLESGQLQIDTIIAGTGLSSSQVSSTLLDLELSGLVGQLPGKVFVRR